jgi:hypothetical protein
MNRNYVIYFCIKDSCDVEFSLPYNSFNSAKDKIDDFLSVFANKRGKHTKIVSKDEFEKIKLLKRPENYFYVRRKNSEAVVYFVNILSGTFYNTYTIEKYGKVGIAEFLIQNTDKKVNVDEIKIKDMHVTNYERGTHVSFVSELKNVLNKREKKTFDMPAKEEKVKSNAFISALIEGKSKLKSQ